MLLHADIVTSWAWEPLTPLLLDAGYRVVALDSRGSGESMTEEVDFSDRADTVAVLDALDIGPAVLVGESVGGQVAIDTAVESPGRVAALVTIGARLSVWSPQQTAEAEKLETELRRAREDDVPDTMADLGVRAWVDGPGQPPDRVPEKIRELVREMDREHLTSGRETDRPIPLDLPTALQLDRLEMPVLATTGELDLPSAVATARHLGVHAPDARAETIPGVARMVSLEAPEELAKSIVGFLAPLARWS